MGSSTSHERNPNVRQTPSSNNPTIPLSQRVDATEYADAFVENALQQCNCGSVLQVFADNEIDEAAFLLLTEEDLIGLLPTKLGPRKKIWNFIQSLRNEEIHSADSLNTTEGHAETLTHESNLNSTQAHSAHTTDEIEPYETFVANNLDTEKIAFSEYSPDNAFTDYAPDTRSGFYNDRADITPLSNEHIATQSVFNSLSLNVQFNNQCHNELPLSIHAEPKSNDVNEEPPYTQHSDDNENAICNVRKEAGHKPDESNAIGSRPVEGKPVKQWNRMKAKPAKPISCNDDKGTMLSNVFQPNKYGNATKKHYSHGHKKQQGSHSLKNRKPLPIYKYKDEFLKMVEQNSVVIVIADTGSGKSTQMPQYLARADYDKKIICTQPRRLAAKSLAKRVAFEYGTELGQGVGYRVRFDNCTENTTKISYVTEGVLVHELATDITASNYSVVIIDEAHERNLNTDVLLGCLKKAIASRPDLKVVISSATVEAKKFSKFFNHAPVLDIPGRSFPVDILYTGRPNPDYLTALIDNVCRLHNGNATGDILVFLPGQEEIEYAADAITEAIRHRHRPNAFTKELVLPLYSKLPSEQQNLIFEPAPLNTRKIILATNIAETSLTIDGIVFVVDCGLVKQAEYVTKANSAALECTTLVTVPITKAQAKQRSGRAGRTQAGVAYRLYSQETYEGMADSPVPEILRGNLEMVVLLLFSMGVKNILQFDFLDSPPKDALLTALEKLQEFEALTKSMFWDEYTLTSIGRQMSGFPIEPYLSKMLIMSADLGCSEEMLTIIAMLSSQTDKLFKRPKSKKMEADLKKKTFDCPEGDHVTLLKVYKEWHRQDGTASRRNWCKEFFLDGRTLEEAYEIRCQLSTMLDEKGIARKSCGDNMSKIQIAIASGSFRKIAWKVSRYTYYTFSNPRDEPVLIHPSSVLFSASPNLVIFNSVIKTKKAYMSQVLEIDREYIRLYASKFYSKLVEVMP